jgi:deazaflavin-dependent oxidoreductase (nitroreductase family)
MDDGLVSSGRYVRVTTRGGRSGLARSVTVGFVDDDGGPTGSILVASGVGSAWARNLMANPACVIETANGAIEAIAERLAGDDHAQAIRGLILRYGTPAESLGRGESFRLRPAGGPPHDTGRPEPGGAP